MRPPTDGGVEGAVVGLAEADEVVARPRLPIPGIRRAFKMPDDFLLESFSFLVAGLPSGLALFLLL